MSVLTTSSYLGGEVFRLTLQLVTGAFLGILSVSPQSDPEGVVGVPSGRMPPGASSEVRTHYH